MNWKVARASNCSGEEAFSKKSKLFLRIYLNKCKGCRKFRTIFLAKMFFTKGVTKSKTFYSCSQKYGIYVQNHEKLNQDEHLHGTVLFCIGLQTVLYAVGYFLTTKDNVKTCQRHFYKHKYIWNFFNKCHFEVKVGETLFFIDKFTSSY